MHSFTNQRGAIPILSGILMFFAGVVSVITGTQAISTSPSPSPTPTSAVVQNTSASPQNGIAASLSCTTKHVSLTVSGNVPAPTNGDNVWSTLTDEKAGQTIVYEVIGSGGIGGPGTMVNINANFNDFVGSIRGEGSLQLFCDGRTYTAKVYYAPFTANLPHLSNLVAQAAASNISSNSSPVPSIVSSPLPSVTPSPTSGNKNGWSYTSAGGVTVIPYPFIDRRMFYVDFESSDFAQISSIYFNLNYDTNLPGTQRGVETTFTPTTDQINGYDPSNNNLPYIRRQLLMGSCSKGVCVFDPNPHNFHLTVTTTYKDGTKYTTVLTLEG